MHTRMHTHVYTYASLILYRLQGDIRLLNQAYKSIHHDYPAYLASLLQRKYQPVPLHAPPIRFYFNYLIT